MKPLHTFTVKNTVKDGDKETVKEISVTIVAPNRAQSKESEIIYAKTYATCMRQGLMTNAEAAKINEERGGVLTDEERKDNFETLKTYLTKERESAALSVAKEGEPEEEKTKRELDLAALIGPLKELKAKIIAYQTKQDAIFEMTAETKAREEVIFFNTLMLVQVDGKPFFAGAKYSDKVYIFDSTEDEFVRKVYRKAVWYITALYYGVDDLNALQYQGEE